MDFDTTELRRLGARRARLERELKELRPKLVEQILAAHAAEVPQVEIAEASSYTRDQVRQITLPPEKKRNRAKTSAHNRAE